MMRKWVELTAIIMMSACYVTMLTIFAVAYFDLNKVITIGIDVYGEAHLEALILLISTPLCVKYLLEQLKSLG